MLFSREDCKAPAFVIIPPRVRAARERAAGASFELSSDDGVGALLDYSSGVVLSTKRIDVTDGRTPQ